MAKLNKASIVSEDCGLLDADRRHCVIRESS